MSKETLSPSKAVRCGAMVVGETVRADNPPVWPYGQPAPFTQRGRHDGGAATLRLTHGEDVNRSLNHNLSVSCFCKKRFRFPNETVIYMEKSRDTFVNYDLSFCLLQSETAHWHRRILPQAAVASATFGCYFLPTCAAPLRAAAATEKKEHPIALPTVAAVGEIL